ncbi:hypothetical protein HPP92_004391 [Vanilla planifolia]|uniref:U-box domain-containing protein n=1 Tax=Vanilla planifolia TaxID=51239 RepID=A0A835RW84_VANPL|nr:hypothetical protein HPP92_004391 [Vanilla planifolia]
MEQVEVPSYFLCPISLQIMRDPVTLPTGITYDRDSIERWLSSGNRNACPVTNQPLPPAAVNLLTPNHTLRRIVQAWCAANSSLGVQRFPTPRPPVDKPLLTALLDDARSRPSPLPALRKLKNLLSDSDRNKRTLAAADSGVVDFLVSIISNVHGEHQKEEEEKELAIEILHALQLTDEDFIQLFEGNLDLLESLTSAMRRSSFQARSHAVQLIKLVMCLIRPEKLLNLGEGFFEEMVKALRDRISYGATEAALRVLNTACRWEPNAARAVDAGAVAVLVDLLLDETEKRASEMMLVVLDVLCRGERGVSEVVRHAAGVAVVSKKILRVTPLATERAVRVLYSIARRAASSEVVEEMVEVGAVAKLCVLLNVECGERTREMAKAILGMHSRVWRSSPCVSRAQVRVL